MFSSGSKPEHFVAKITKCGTLIHFANSLRTSFVKPYNALGYSLMSLVNAYFSSPTSLRALGRRN
jgi:hypothetical protein